MSIGDYWLLADTQLRMQQCIADMEAMKVANELKRTAGEPLPYSDECFLTVVENLQKIRDDLRKHFIKEISKKRKVKNGD